MHIPHFFLQNQILSIPGDTVLDPFCGSGTVLLESFLAGRQAVGADANPMASLISQVKTRPITAARVERSLSFCLDHIPTGPIEHLPDVVNLEHWFYPHVVQQLARLNQAICRVPDVMARRVLKICFSNCVKKVSLADPRLSVPVRLRQGQYPEGHWLRDQTDAHLRRLRKVNVTRVFETIATANIRRLTTIENLPQDIRPQIRDVDARRLSLEDSSVDLAITSPPYVGAQKYIRSLGLSLGWLGLCESTDMRRLKSESIGREEFRLDERANFLRTGIAQADSLLDKVRDRDPLRAHIAATYLIEMSQAIQELGRVIRRQGHLVLVVGNNRVAQLPFYGARYLQTLAENNGFRLRLSLVDDIHSRGLMTKRNATANTITREHVLLLQKE